jgi:hypothetical protein
MAVTATIEIAGGFQQTAKEIKQSAPIRFVFQLRRSTPRRWMLANMAQYPGGRGAILRRSKGAVHNAVSAEQGRFRILL